MYYELEQKHLTIHKQSYPYYSKEGLRDYPAPSLGAQLRLEAATPQGKVLDASDSLGLSRALFPQADIDVLSCSRAVKHCTDHTYPQRPCQSAALWSVPPEHYDSLLFIPSFDKGNKRIEAELQAAQRLLKPKGKAYVVFSKDGGAKRYERWLREYFGDSRVVARKSPWRLSEATKLHESVGSIDSELNFEARGIACLSQVGVHAAGKTDPGTALLLDSIDHAIFQGKSALDLGCGYGLISLSLASYAAKVYALDDDLLAVESCQGNATRLGFDNICCAHSDVASGLEPSKRCDFVVCNPPFHIGKQVSFVVPKAFIQAAHHHLKTNGELFLVANKALPYEREFEAWGELELLAQNQHFKVLRAKK